MILSSGASTIITFIQSVQRRVLAAPGGESFRVSLMDPELLRSVSFCQSLEWLFKVSSKKITKEISDNISFETNFQIVWLILGINSLLISIWVIFVVFYGIVDKQFQTARRCVTFLREEDLIHNERILDRLFGEARRKEIASREI